MNIEIMATETTILGIKVNLINCGDINDITLWSFLSFFCQGKKLIKRTFCFLKTERKTSHSSCVLIEHVCYVEVTPYSTFSAFNSLLKKYSPIPDGLCYAMQKLLYSKKWAKISKNIHVDLLSIVYMFYLRILFNELFIYKTFLS